MTIGGLGGGAGSVGWIYVNVLADTSGMKDKIEDDAGEAGAAGGKKAGNQFDRNLTSKLQKQSASRAIRKVGQKYGEEFAAEFAKSGKEGTAFVLDSRKVKAEISKLAKQYGLNFNKVSAQVGDQISASFSKALDQIEKDAVKAANAVAAEAEKLAKQQERENKARLDRETRAAEAAARSLAQRQIRDAERAAVRATQIAERAAERAEKIKERAAERADRRAEQRIAAEERADAARVRKEARDAARVAKQIADAQIKADVVVAKRREALFTAVSVRIAQSGRRGGTFTRVLGGSARGFTSFFEIAAKLQTLALGKVLEGFSKGFGALSQVVGGFPSRAFGSIGKGFGVIASVVQSNLIVSIVTFAAGLGALVNFAVLLSPLLINIAGIITLLGAAVGNAASALALFVPIFIALGVGAAVTAVALKDFTGSAQALFKAGASGDPKDWQAYVESLENLGPAAKRTAQALEPLAKSFKGVQDEIEELFFRGLDETFERAVGPIQGFKEEILGIAEASGDTFNRIFDGIFDNEIAVESLNTLLLSTRNIIDDIGFIVADVFVGFTNIFAGASPAAERLSTAIAGIAEGFRLWSESDENRAGVLNFFNGALDVGGKVFNIIKLLGELIITVFTQSQGPLSANEGILSKIEGVLERAITWLNENPDALERFFADATAFADAVWDAIKGIVKAFADWNTPENQQWLLDVVEGFGTLAGLALDLLGTVQSLIRDIPLLFGGGILTGLAALARAFGGVESSAAAARRAQDGVRATSKTDPYVIKPSSQGPPASIARPSTPPAAARTPDLSWRTSLLRRDGGVIDKPTKTILGEVGPELIIPLKGQIGDVDPIVREISRSLRGPKQSKSGEKVDNSKTINLTQHITPMHADPNNVAASAMNRAIALARM